MKTTKQGKEKNVDEERSILIAGSKRGGKSSVVLRFLDRLMDVPKPTMALEYTFGRRYVCVCMCMCACACACVRVHVRVRMCARVRVCA